MKKFTILYLLSSLLICYQSFSQCGSISMIGEFSEWAEDIFMTPDQADPDIYKGFLYLDVTDDPDMNGVVEMKFRQDSSWMINWGNVDFPEGDGMQNGPNIPASYGNYFVTFNCSTGHYFFQATSGAISMIGEFNEYIGDLYMDRDLEDISMFTTVVSFTVEDDMNLDGFVDIKFRENGEWINNWGGTEFPQGYGIMNGPVLPVPYGNYKVSFDSGTLLYTFELQTGIDEIADGGTLTGLPGASGETLAWAEQYSGTNNMLLSVCFVTTEDGWVVGGNGTILHTMDGGVEWAPQVSGTYSNLYKVTFLDVNHGWACGNNGTIIYTSDGGQNWISQVSGTTDEISSIFFIDLMHGWATCNYETFPYWGNIIHTNDGGQTWEVQNTGLNEWILFSDIYFRDNLHGWAGGHIFSQLLATQDGGNTWQLLSNGPYVFDFEFLSESIGVSCGGNGIDMTTNGGATWQNKYSSENDINALCFADYYYGYAVGEFGEFARSTNSGYTWTKQNFEEPLTFHGIDFPARDTGWVVGNNGKIFHTTNGGLVNIKEEMAFNHPNPFSYSTSIEYELEDAGHVTLMIFNQTGQLVKTLVDEYEVKGRYEATWNAMGMPVGIYLFRLTNGNKSYSGKMVLN